MSHTHERTYGGRGKTLDGETLERHHVGRQREAASCSDNARCASSEKAPASYSLAIRLALELATRQSVNLDALSMNERDTLRKLAEALQRRKADAERQEDTEIHGETRENHQVRAQRQEQQAQEQLPPQHQRQSSSDTSTSSEAAEPARARAESSQHRTHGDAERDVEPLVGQSSHEWSADVCTHDQAEAKPTTTPEALQRAIEGMVFAIDVLQGDVHSHSISLQRHQDEMAAVRTEMTQLRELLQRWEASAASSQQPPAHSGHANERDEPTDTKGDAEAVDAGHEIVGVKRRSPRLAYSQEGTKKCKMCVGSKLLALLEGIKVPPATKVASDALSVAVDRRPKVPNAVPREQSDQESRLVPLAGAASVCTDSQTNQLMVKND
ncbi:hypothetical protein ATCC90586_005440 [Pythium insidiosum]|nr:hypothetical protein ATCC90586_005440 [Pythium insidiosum]